MTNTSEQIRFIWEQWNERTKRRDADALMEIYAEDAVFESPAVMAMYPERGDGILHGKPAIGTYFNKVLSEVTAFGDFFRSDTYFSDGNTLVWEYPRETPNGEQAGIAESMDIVDGLIVHHRVYWGWRGVKALIHNNADK